MKTYYTFLINSWITAITRRDIRAYAIQTQIYNPKRVSGLICEPEPMWMDSIFFFSRLLLCYVGGVLPCIHWNNKLDYSTTTPWVSSVTGVGCFLNVFSFLLCVPFSEKRWCRLFFSFTRVRVCHILVCCIKFHFLQTMFIFRKWYVIFCTRLSLAIL